MLIGAVATTLAVGLVIPFAVGEPEDDHVSAVESFDFDSVGDAPATSSSDEQSSTSNSTVPVDTASNGGPSAGGSTPLVSGDVSVDSGTEGPGPGQVPAVETGKPATGDPVRVGFLLIDLGNAGGLGFPGIGSVEDQAAIYQAYVDNANANGGAGGRPIEAVFASFDPLSDASMRAACLRLTEDEKVFAALTAGGFVGDAILCFTQEHGTPLLAGVSGAPVDFYTKSNGLLFTMFSNSNRMVKNLAQEAHDLGALDGKTIGILYDLRYGPASVAEQLKREVEGLGHKVGHVTIFSADFGSASTQVPVEINRHRSANVDVMLNMSNAVAFAQFVQQADAQRYVIPYFNSDWNGANSDFYYSNMPASYNGNLNFTVARTNEGMAGLPEPALDAECRRLAEKAIGRSIPQDDPEDTTFARSCTFFTVLRMGLAGVGPNLTTARFSQSLQAVGDFPAPNMSTGRLGAGRFDWGASLRTMQWKSDCRCLLPVTDFRRAKH